MRLGSFNYNTNFCIISFGSFVTYRTVSLFIPQFMIFMALETRDKTCLKTEKTWFLLVHWLAKNSKVNVTTCCNNFLT